MFDLALQDLRFFWSFLYYSWSSTHVLFFDHRGTFCAGGLPNVSFCIGTFIRTLIVFISLDSENIQKLRPGYPLHRENRENRRKKIPVRENTGNLEILPKLMENTGNLVCSSCKFLILKVKDISKFAAKISKKKKKKLS